MPSDWAQAKAREWLEGPFGKPYPEGDYAPSVVKSLAALLDSVREEAEDQADAAQTKRLWDSRTESDGSDVGFVSLPLPCKTETLPYSDNRADALAEVALAQEVK